MSTSTSPVTALTPRAWIYTAVSVVAPFLALGLGDPAPVLVAAPMAMLLTFGLLTQPRGQATLESSIDAGQVFEQGRVRLELDVVADGSHAHVDLRLPTGLAIEEVDGARRAGRSGLVVGLRRGRGRAEVVVRAERWGGYRIGDAVIRISGSVAMRVIRFEVEGLHRLAVLPESAEIRRLIEPLSTSMHSGDLVSARRGPGFEMAETRRWAPGDSPRSINWRASARSDRLWVTERHADRNGDLILVVDPVAEPGSDVEQAVRHLVELAAGLVDAYGASRHRLGLIDIGGLTRWFGLDSGPLHHHRLLEAVISIQMTPSPVWMAVDRVLDRAVRPPSMVVFVTPLVDGGVVGRIRRLAIAGIDVMALAVDPAPWARPTGDDPHRLARRIWRMERARAIDLLRSIGVAVGEWSPGAPVDELMEEVELWRRRMRRLRA